MSVAKTDKNVLLIYWRKESESKRFSPKIPVLILGMQIFLRIAQKKGGDIKELKVLRTAETLYKV